MNQILLTAIYCGKARLDTYCGLRRLNLMKLWDFLLKNCSYSLESHPSVLHLFYCSEHENIYWTNLLFGQVFPENERNWTEKEGSPPFDPAISAKEKTIGQSDLFFRTRYHLKIRVILLED